jgi:hypothetical protein
MSPNPFVTKNDAISDLVLQVRQAVLACGLPLWFQRSLDTFMGTGIPCFLTRGVTESLNCPS